MVTLLRLLFPDPMMHDVAYIHHVLFSPQSNSPNVRHVINHRPYIRLNYTPFTPKSLVGTGFRPRSHCTVFRSAPVYTEPRSALLFPMNVIKNWLFEGLTKMRSQKATKGRDGVYSAGHWLMTSSPAPTEAPISVFQHYLGQITWVPSTYTAAWPRTDPWTLDYTRVG